MITAWLSHLHTNCWMHVSCSLWYSSEHSGSHSFFHCNTLSAICHLFSLLYLQSPLLFWILLSMFKHCQNSSHIKNQTHPQLQKDTSSSYPNFLFSRTAEFIKELPIFLSTFLCFSSICSSLASVTFQPQWLMLKNSMYTFQLLKEQLQPRYFLLRETHIQKLTYISPWIIHGCPKFSMFQTGFTICLQNLSRECW